MALPLVLARASHELTLDDACTLARGDSVRWRGLDAGRRAKLETLVVYIAATAHRERARRDRTEVWSVVTGARDCLVTGAVCVCVDCRGVASCVHSNLDEARKAEKSSRERNWPAHDLGRHAPYDIHGQSSHRGLEQQSR